MSWSAEVSMKLAPSPARTRAGPSRAPGPAGQIREGLQWRESRINHTGLIVGARSHRSPNSTRNFPRIRKDWRCQLAGANLGNLVDSFNLLYEHTHSEDETLAKAWHFQNLQCISTHLKPKFPPPPPPHTHTHTHTVQNALRSPQLIPIYLFHSNSDQFQMSAASPEIITSHSMENLAFHSLPRWKNDCTTNSHFITHTLPYKRLG